MAPVSRRDLIIGGSAAVGGVAIGATVLNFWGGNTPTPTPSVPSRVTFDSWVANRRAPYYIGHRGAGGVSPEHTLPSYLRALEWGIECIEISIVMSSDRVLYCLHDLTLDRTTTMSGEARAKTSDQLETARVSIPRLGPRWGGSNMPTMPRLRDVLGELGGKAILCIEPKDDAAYPALIELIKELQLEDSVMIKLDGSSQRIESAKEAGFPVFAYLGNAEVATEKNIRALAGRLDPRRDALILPARDNLELMPANLFRIAVGTGVPVWVFPVHRRHEAQYFTTLGVQGLIAASYGYLAAVVPPAKTDDFASGELASGMLTRSPYVNAFALAWEDEGVVTIPTPGRQAFVTLGQFCPIEASSYRISFDVSFSQLPSDKWQHMSISFARADDRYYEHRLGDADGYHALLRANGSMGLYAHVEGDPIGQELTKSQQSTPMKSGLWARMTLDVTPDSLSWARDDGTTIHAKDTRFRGGYFHIGSSATDGALRLRNVTVG